jgi:hypothetical protein
MWNKENFIQIFKILKFEWNFNLKCPKSRFSSRVGWMDSSRGYRCHWVTAIVYVIIPEGGRETATRHYLPWWLRRCPPSTITSQTLLPPPACHVGGFCLHLAQPRWVLRVFGGRGWRAAFYRDSPLSVVCSPSFAAAATTSLFLPGCRRKRHPRGNASPSPTSGQGVARYLGQGAARSSGRGTVHPRRQCQWSGPVAVNVLRRSLFQCWRYARN